MLDLSSACTWQLQLIIVSRDITHRPDQCCLYPCRLKGDPCTGLSNQRYLSTIPSTGRVWHKAFFMVDQGTGPLPRCTWQLQKCLGLRRHSAKKGGPQTPGDKSTPPMSVRAWEDGPLRLEVCQSRDVTRARTSLPLTPRPAEGYVI